MNERDVFLRAIESNEDDTLIRLVFADWLDEHGEHEEAERQRQVSVAKTWLFELCKKLPESPEGRKITYDDLIAFGHEAAETNDLDIEVYGITNCREIVTTLQDQIPAFWRAWGTVTNLPINAEYEQKCYFVSGYCCAIEIYPDIHIAGPMSKEFLERQQQFREDETQSMDTGREEELERIQEELEGDLP